jgi:apolipoprotein D and lipocalin family protein
MALLSLLGGCASGHPPLLTAPHVDLPRFMGDWYVIANIPTAIERGAHNAVESYRLEADGTIATTFTFRDGSFDGKLKTYHPRGFVKDRASNAVWGMQFIWPIKADYRIVYVSSDYQRTIVGREKRDNVWIMARTPQISDAEYADLRQRVAREGYDLAKLELVPQQPPGN